MMSENTVNVGTIGHIDHDTPHVSKDELAPCPFCEGTNISSGEVLGKRHDGKYFSQTACTDCGAAGPETICSDATDLRLEIECDGKWNRRVTRR